MSFFKRLLCCMEQTDELTPLRRSEHASRHAPGSGTSAVGVSAPSPSAVDRTFRGQRAPAPRSRPNEIEMERLVLQMLLELPRAVTESFEIHALDNLCTLCEEDEAEIVRALDACATLPTTNPLTYCCIAILVDNLPPPSMRFLPKLAASFEKRLAIEADQVPTEHRARGAVENTLLVVADLARRVAGHSAIVLMTQTLLQRLTVLLKLADSWPSAARNALIAIEALAVTGKNKERILQADLQSIVLDLEKRFSRAESGGTTGPTTDAQSVRHHLACTEAGFLATWLLENVMPVEGRTFAADRLKSEVARSSDSVGAVPLRRHRAVLDVRDATPNLKLAFDGIEARNDAVEFESVRATCGVPAGEKGVWFYECTILSGGIMQLGWAGPRCEYLAEEGRGIGDDDHSLAFDGCRHLLWRTPRPSPVPLPSWKPGDVVGCAINAEEGTFTFALNGRWLPWRGLPQSLKDTLQGTEVSPEGDSANPGTNAVHPAVSIMSHQHIIFNFGQDTYRFPPPEPFSSLCAAAGAEDVQYVTPRLQVIAEMQKQRAEIDLSKPSCVICFDATPDARLLPCKHDGFCQDCAGRMERCPLCRTEVEEVGILTAQT